MERWLWVAVCLAAGSAVPLPHEMDSEQTRKLLGSSVVTSVSVIMDHGNGTKTYITDGDTEKKPQVVGTPGTFLSPDRYEFYSFGEDGELVKKLMTLDQIQSLIAGGDELDPLPVYDPQPLIDNTHTEGVHKVLESVQNVLKGELQAAKVRPKLPMPLPDDSWSILLPGLLNSDLDLKESHLPPKTETSTAKTSTTQNVIKGPAVETSSRRPTQSTTVRSTSRPATQTTISQQTSTIHFTQAQQSTKPVTSRPTIAFSTSPPNVQTTAAVSNKPVSQKPQTTSKKPILSTKKPYVSETPLVKVSLSSTQKFDLTTKPTTTFKMPTTVVEERTPSTKFPETKKPIPEKQKPSGIPTITHYLPISSMSPSSSTSPSLTEPTTLNQKLSYTSKEPIRVTTTKRPSTFPTTQMTTQKVTKRPIQNEVPAVNKTQPNNTSQNDKIVVKNPKPTASTTSTRIQTTTTTLAPTTTVAKVSKVPIGTNELLSTSTEKLETHPEAETESMSTTSMPVTNSIPVDLEKHVLEKHSGIVSQNNLIGENSNVVHTKVKPSESLIVTNSTPDSSENVTSSSTPFPEKFTTFSYSSKITPTGEIITISQPIVNSTLDKSNISASMETTMASTVTPTTVRTSTTEKPLERVTSIPLQSSNPIETIRDHILVSSSMQPTTYHPHNFSLPAEKNQVQILSSTTPIYSTLSTHFSTESTKKRRPTTNLPITEQPSYNSTSPIPLAIISNSSTISVATTLPSVTKPTTLVDNVGETTVAATIPISNATSETTINDSNTYPTEEMPLQEIPLKIYESLKDNISGAQELLTTIMSENLSTTPGKLENFYSTNFEMTAPTTTTTTDKGITILDLVSSTIIPQNNFVIINNSEPHILEKNAVSFNSNSENELNVTTTNEPTQYSTVTPFDRNSSAFESTSQDETTTFSTTVPANNSELESLETTPNLDSTTIYKDHIVQEGISAVTSILLDQAQKQQAMKQAILATAIKNEGILEMERIRTTTEDERISTTMSDSTETSVGKFGTDGDQMKSEVRQDEDAELPEKYTTVAVEITTPSEKQKTETLIKDEIKVSSNVSTNKQQLKKTEQKATSVVPTKESKLNPETDHMLKKKNSNKQHADNTPLLRTSPLPEFSATTERLKLSDSEKPVPKPLSSFVKKPSSVYQSLENLPPVAIELNPAPYESMGLEASIAFLGEDVRRFADLCNELAFKLWTSITGKGQIASRSLVMSPFAVTSLLAMVFLGARGPTSGQMNDVLRLDDMVTFNPHQVLQNVTESVINSKNNGVATASFVRELYSDKSKGKILDFYKERVQQYYQGHVEEVTFTTIGDIIRRRTNLLVKRQTLGKVPEYLRGSSLNMRPPLAAFSANIFQTDCEHGSTEGRDGEMYFVVRPSTRQRRLVPVPAVVWRSGFLAGYETSLDATSVCLGPESVVSTILILPGQQGQVAPGDGLARLEQRLIETTYRRGGWSQILRSLMPRPGLELQIPRFSHRSVLNMTGALQRMGLRDLFNARRADLRGLNGLSNDLHLSDMLQVNTFSTCGEETIGARHHVETYPASPQRIGRDENDHYSARDLDNSFGDLQLSLRPRQARLPDNPRLRFDRPFLYIVRHNPSGMILHMGRFNPRLLP